jgi:hypothetical protein
MVRPFTSSTQGSLHFASCEPIIKVAFAVRLRRQLRWAPHESQPSEVQRPSLDLIDFFDFCLPRQVSKVIDSLARCLGAYW